MPSRATPRESRAASVALVGNPNTGKTSLFNALTGFRRHVANYPGVTVEIASGPIRHASRPLTLVDLPGTYSLAAVSPDEFIVSELLAGRVSKSPRPDVVVAILDASNLTRNLYLLSQVLECGLPVVVALNMVDIAAARGIRVDAALLAERLGVPVVPIVATREESTRPLVAQIERAVAAGAPRAPAALPAALAGEVAQLSRAEGGGLSHAEAARVLLDAGGIAERQYLQRSGSREALLAARARLAQVGVDGAAEVRSRYVWAQRVSDGVMERPSVARVTVSQRLDRVLTHPVFGSLILIAVLFLVFQTIFSGAAPLMRLIEAAFGWLGELVGAAVPDGVLRSLLLDGVIAGVGGVVVFLPQILILFAFIAVLEDCGYMSRAAFMVDRLTRVVGLSGRAFIPLLSSFACAVPAIMGTRAIADPRERFITIMIAPFMSCSARLPVYTLMISAFVPEREYLGGWIGLRGLVMLAMYLVGVIVAIPVAWLLKRIRVPQGPGFGFLLELPTYKLPRLRAVWQRMSTAGRGFLVRAGGVILVVNLIVWALAWFPRDRAVEEDVRRTAVTRGWDEDRTEHEVAGAYLRSSFLGRMGHAIEPAVRPIGWDWRIGMAVIASFPAREVVVATLSTICNLGGDVGENDVQLQDAVRSLRWEGTEKPLFDLPAALALMVFFALCAQCTSTLAVIGRELRSWTWPLASFLGMTTIAYVAAWATATGARALGL